MDKLRASAEAYKKLVGKDYQFTFANGASICVRFSDSNFKHLAGLNKLIDLKFISAHTPASLVFKWILDGRITLLDLQASMCFDSDASERIENLARIDEVLRTGKVIYPFEKSKCRVATRLRSEVIFFKDDGLEFYLTLGAAKKENMFYPETFFLRYDSAYIKGQNIVEVVALDIRSHRGNK